MASYQGKRLSQVDHRDVPFNDGVRATMEQGAVVRAGVEKTSAKVGDLPGFAQLVVEQRSELDMTRTAAISVFAATIGGYGNYVFLRGARRETLQGTI